MSKWLSVFFVCFSLVSASPLMLPGQQNFDSIKVVDGKNNGIEWNTSSRSQDLFQLPIQSTGEKAVESVSSLISKSSPIATPIFNDYRPVQEEQDVMDREELMDEQQYDNPANEPPALSDWPGKSISQIQLSPMGVGKAPADQSNRLLEKYVRDWSLLETREKIYRWESPQIRYQPLLFEDIALERNGQVVLNDNFQTVVSAVHFFTSAALLPLHARHDPVYSCDYPLGYARPGNCSRKIFQRPFWGLNR